MFDVLLDLRPDSPSYLRHVSVSLDEENRDAVFIPHGIAHGFRPCPTATEVLYQMTDAYARIWLPASGGTIRALIEWPCAAAS